jgi:hypothetical protein
MGTLPSYLHHAFAAACPPGWSVQPEVAPSKFCAYSDVTAPTPQATMTIARYGSLDGREPRFDGHRARLHLTRHLGFSEQPLAALPTAVQTAFAQWLRANADTISVHPRGPIILMPPAWFR